MAQPSTVATRRTSARLKARQSVRAHSTITGVTTSAPATSPSHQVTQIGLKLAQAAKPARHNVTTPTVALMTVAGPALIRTNFATRPGLANVSLPPDQRLIR